MAMFAHDVGIINSDGEPCCRRLQAKDKESKQHLLQDGPAAAARLRNRKKETRDESTPGNPPKEHIISDVNPKPRAGRKRVLDTDCKGEARTSTVDLDVGTKPGKAPKTEHAGSRAVSKGTAPKGGPTFNYEKKWWGKGKARVAGVDEAGRGPLAGPVVAAACVVPEGIEIPGVNDSKQLTEAQREEIYEFLIAHPQAVGSLEGGQPDAILVDGNRCPAGLKAETTEVVVKGDAKCISIAAASVLAKVGLDTTKRRQLNPGESQSP
eukprot:1183917-Prorocentrum_minimum.AAC.5